MRFLILTFCLWTLASFASAQEEPADFGMIGVALSDFPDYGRISSILPNTPASKSGMLEGDRILAVNCLDINLLAFKDLLTFIRGEPGTEIVLTVRHADTGEIERIKLVRMSYKAYRAVTE